MSRRKFKFFSYSKMIAPALAAVGVVVLSTMNACSPSDRSTAAREEVIAQNALDAERAEEQLAKEGDKTPDHGAKAADHGAKAAEHGAKTADHGAKAQKTAAVPKQPKVKPEQAKPEHKTAAVDAKAEPKHDAKAEPKHDAKAEPKHDAKHDNEKTPAAHLAENELAGHASPARKPASVSGGTYVVQVGAFRVKENAEKLQAKLKEAGYKVDMQTVEHSKNGLLHLVRFEPTTNRAEAETMVEDLHAKHELAAQILSVR